MASMRLRFRTVGSGNEVDGVSFALPAGIVDVELVARAGLMPKARGVTIALCWNRFLQDRCRRC